MYCEKSSQSPLNQDSNLRSWRYEKGTLPRRYLCTFRLNKFKIFIFFFLSFLFNEISQRITWPGVYEIESLRWGNNIMTLNFDSINVVN